MNTFKLKIRTPFNLVMDEEINSLNVSTEAGQVTVLPHHSKLISTIIFSPLIIKKSTGDEEFLLRGGIMQVDNDTNSVNILCELCTEKFKSVYFEEIENLKNIQEKLETKDKNIFNDMQYAYLEDQMIAAMRKIAYLEKYNIGKDK